MEMDFVGTFELEYGRMVDFSKIIVVTGFVPGWPLIIITGRQGTNPVTAMVLLSYFIRHNVTRYRQDHTFFYFISRLQVQLRTECGIFAVIQTISCNR